MRVELTVDATRQRDRREGPRRSRSRPRRSRDRPRAKRMKLSAGNALRQAGAVHVRHLDALRAWRIKGEESLPTRRSPARTVAALPCSRAGCDRFRAGQARRGETTARQPKLTQAAEARALRRGAPIRSRRRLPGKTASVVLQIAITDKGNVEDAVDRADGGPGLRRGGARRREASSCSSRPRSTTSPRRSRSPTATTSCSRRNRSRRSSTSTASVKNRFTKEPLAGVTVDARGHRRGGHRRRGPLRVQGRPARVSTPSPSPAPDLTPVTHRGDHREGQEARGEVRGRAEGRGPRGRGGGSRDRGRRAPRSRRRSSRPRSRPRKAAASPARRATRSRSCRTCRASRAPRSAPGSSWCGAPRRKTRASTSTACAFRSSITAAACARRSTPTWCARSISRPAATAPSTVAVSAASSRSTRARCARIGVHGYVAADIIDAVGDARGAGRRASTRVAIAGRKSYLDEHLVRCSSDEDVSDFVPIPRLLRRAGEGQHTISARTSRSSCSGWSRAIT